MGANAPSPRRAAAIQGVYFAWQTRCDCMVGMLPGHAKPNIPGFAGNACFSQPVAAVVSPDAGYADQVCSKGRNVRQAPGYGLGG